jgi:Holliday junction resolvase
MAATPEKKVKQKLMMRLRELGAYAFYPATGGYGHSGVPDIVGCHKGVFFGIECKAGKNKVTALQERNLKQIHEAGGVSCVCYEDDIELTLNYICRAAGCEYYG